jgi:1-acyl-sn-glycerol-3-phosphate acyltransferase
MPSALLTIVVIWLAVVTAAWVLSVCFLRQGPGGVALNGLLWYVVKIYLWIRHRPTYRGEDILPGDDDEHDGLIVVSNHTGALDPLLIQARCRFLIRWMMASDMMGPSLDWLWRDEYVIPVDRNGKDSGPLREAIRHLKRGGALGIFPEGRITTPPREIRPFLPGIGMLVAKTKAPVLLAWVSGTPDTNQMGEAFATKSESHVEFVELIDFGDERDAQVITDALRQHLHEHTGWPLNDEVLPPGGVNGDEDTAAAA